MADENIPQTAIYGTEQVRLGGGANSRATGAGMNLEQAKRISELSTAPSDGCTLFPDMGFRPLCTGHDHWLQHLVLFTDPLNPAQIEYMHEQGLYEYVLWAASRGKMGKPFTWKMANHLFRESLDKKIDEHSNPIKKIWYWGNRNVFYFGVTLWRRLRHLL